jgi:hypothetical protein
MNGYFKQIKETLLYFDFQPLLFFWVTSDILNNQVLWTTLDYWDNLGQSYTYWLYLSHLIASVGIIISIHNIKWVSRFILLHLTIVLYSTIKYILNIYTTIDSEPLTLVDCKNLTITLWYTFMWLWILFKLKKEILHKSLK